MILEIIFLLLSFTLLIVFIIYWEVIRPEKKVYDALHAQGIKGESFVPLLGQLPRLRKYRNADNIMGFYEDQLKRFGPVYISSFGPSVRLAIMDPDLLADVFNRSNSQNYVKPTMVNTVFEPIIGLHNLLISEGEEHERARRMLNPAFHHHNLKSMISIIVSRTENLIKSFNDTNQDLQLVFNSLTLSIIVSSAFGSDLETNTNAKDIMSHVLAEVFDAVIYRSMRMVNQIPFLAKLPMFKKETVDKGGNIIGNFVDQIIIDRRQGRSTSMSTGPDLLDLLLSAVDPDGKPFTDQEIKDQALTFVVAGSETTGNLMVWMFYMLMIHDDVFKACREEVDRILPNGTELTHEILSELNICDAVIHETLRLYPPATFFARQCIREHTIGGDKPIHLPVGSCVLINSYMLHRREEFWPRPYEFDYTRWMRDAKTGLKPKLSHPFAFLPFAAGTRNCIGQNFALLEAKIMLAMFVKHCDFKLVPGQKIVPDVKITLRTKYGLWAKITRRSDHIST